MGFSQANEDLADCCQASGAACCKKGKIFLPESQHSHICNWIQKNSTEDELREFQSRCENHGNYFVYDQQNNCQFLDGNNLCRLHVDGVKPLECYWWPLHVYVDSQGALFVGSADYCCGGCGTTGDLADHLRQIEKQAEAIGKELIRAFRANFPGRQKYKTLKVLG